MHGSAAGLRLGEPLHAVLGQPFDSSGEAIHKQAWHRAVADERVVVVHLGVDVQLGAVGKLEPDGAGRVPK
jgi:hypothetical protein